MLLISFAFAWIVFLLALNISGSMWKSIVSAIIAFIAFLLILKFELFVPLCITIGILVVAIIVVLIKINTR